MRTGYWGNQAIADRLGVAPNTVTEWTANQGLPVIQRRQIGKRMTWWLDETLLIAWLLQRSQRDRAKWNARRAQRRAKRDAAQVPPVSE